VNNKVHLIFELKIVCAGKRENKNIKRRDEKQNLSYSISVTVCHKRFLNRVDNEEFQVRERGRESEITQR